VADTLTADAVVIGAGVAGCAAAVSLAAAGRRVVVLEEAPRLGGRATSFVDRATGERVDNGQHALFGCYHETYALLREIGADALAPLERQLRLAIVSADGDRSVLECPAWPPPWHLAGGVLKWKALPWRDRASAVRLGPLLRRVPRAGAAAIAAEVDPRWTVDDWLRAKKQSPLLCQWLWHPLAIAALNQSPHVAAAQPFVRVLAELFGPRVEDSAIGLPKVPLDELFAAPAQRFVEAHGGRVLVKSPARIRLDEGGHLIGATTDGLVVSAPIVISTVPWHAFARIWPGELPPAVRSIAAAAAAMRSSPIVTVNAWYDGPVMTDRFVGLIGGTMQWVFDKSAIFGEQAGHLSIVASGTDDLATLENEEIAALAVRQLARALPQTSTRRLLRSVVVREHRASFSLAPGEPTRPSCETPVRGFYLGGDWTDTGLPGTIEGAALSGRRAAASALRAMGR
jgi:zeta-carotene desaturase